MLIVCPSCAASYSLTEEQLGRGRTLRCAQCRHTWFVSPEAPASDGLLVEAVPPPPVAPVVDQGPSAEEPAPKSRPARPRKERKPRPSALALLKKTPRWQAALAALLVVLGIATLQRRAVVQAAPQSARLFAALGLPVNLRGLALDEVRSQLALESEQSALVVEGEIRNVTHAERTVPALQVSLRNADGREIYSWTAEAPRAALAAGESIPFRTRLVAPPLDGRDVLVRFARDETSAPVAH